MAMAGTGPVGEEMRGGYEEGPDAMDGGESSGSSLTSSSLLNDGGGYGELPRNSFDDADNDDDDVRAEDSGDDAGDDAGDDEVDLDALYEEYHKLRRSLDALRLRLQRACELQNERFTGGELGTVLPNME
jgi:hypothetical protein